MRGTFDLLRGTAARSAVVEGDRPRTLRCGARALHQPAAGPPPRAGRIS
ncbi:hypothetical protein AB5I41_18230 [Sphingomonas sp. MMS24-JH45]